MSQLVILSGKGGTGKTTVAASFVKLVHARVYADCDVEAPNLHLLFSFDEQPEKTEFIGMPKAIIRGEDCIGCGICRDRCRFGAVRTYGGVYEIADEACEGCGLCAALCPSDAIDMVPAPAGELMYFADDRRMFSTAQLRIGAGTSGKLVTAVKDRVKESSATELTIVDGPPGIGCPTIASLSGAETVLLVVEPTLSGTSDLERILKMIETTRCQVLVCVNRYDLNLERTEQIENFCRERDIGCVGRIPYDPDVVHAVNRGTSIADLSGPAGAALRAVFDRTIASMETI